MGCILKSSVARDSRTGACAQSPRTVRSVGATLTPCGVRRIFSCRAHRTVERESNRREGASRLTRHLTR